MESARSEMYSTFSILFFFADEVTIRAHAQEVYQYRDHVPHDYWPRSNQQAIVDPEDLKSPHDRRHPRIHTRT